MDLENIYELLDYLEIDDFEDITLSVGYTNAEGDYNEFDITDISKSEYYGERYIEAFCVNKDGEYEGIQRTFKISRFDTVEVIVEDND